MEPIELRGESGSVWQLHYPLRSLLWFEEQTGVSFQKSLNRLGENDFSLGDTMVLVAAGLRHKIKNADIDLAEEVIEDAGYGPTLEAVAKALQRSTIMKGTKDQDGVAEVKNGGTSGTGTKRGGKRRGSD